MGTYFKEHLLYILNKLFLTRLSNERKSFIDATDIDQGHASYRRLQAHLALLLGGCTRLLLDLHLLHHVVLTLGFKVLNPTHGSHLVST